MNRTWPLGVVLLLAAPALAEERSRPPGRLEMLRKQYEDAGTAYRKATKDLPDTPEGDKKAGELSKDYDNERARLFKQAVELAKADPKSETGFAALEWVLTIPRSYYLPGGKEALELAAMHHAANPKIGKIVAWIGYFTPPEIADSHDAAMALIRAVADKNPDRTARGQAVMSLAWQAKTKFAVAEYRRTSDVEERAIEAEKALKAVVKDYADCPRLLRESTSTLGEVAGRELYELRHLRIGKPAPEIKGEDLDGKQFKLSDYRGKVVVLDFWGDW